MIGTEIALDGLSSGVPKMSTKSSLFQIASLLLLFSACAKKDEAITLATHPEFTGGVHQESQRPFTQTSDGSDHALADGKAKLMANQFDAAPAKISIADIRISPVQNQFQILIFLKDNESPLKFVGQLPTQMNALVKISNDDAKESLTLSCTADPNCPNTLLGELQTSAGKATFTLRTTKAQGRILYLSKHDEFEIKNTFGLHYKALPEFLAQFQSSTPLAATSTEVVFGKSAAYLRLSWREFQICLDADVTTTDQGVLPLTAVKVSCGQEFLPKMKIDLVGNNQKGKIALRFNLDERFTFILFVDLNGGKIADPLLPVEPDMLIPDNGFVAQPVFPMKLESPRTFNVAKQFYTDMPTPGNKKSLVLPEQKYGFSIVQNWIEKWQGDKDDPSSCWGKDGGDHSYKASLVQFLKSGPGYFKKVKSMFEKADVPANFMFLSVVESPRFYREKSKIEVSKDGAVGPWQIMESVAQDWGLKFFPLIGPKTADPRDERVDFEKSSQAAVSQLSRLLGYFGEADYKLSIAAYNQGAGSLLKPFFYAVDIRAYEEYFEKYFGDRANVVKPDNYRKRIEQNKNAIGEFNPKTKFTALMKQWNEKIPSFWFLHEFHMMSCETRDYVPKTLAAMFIGENPQAFGF